MGARHALHFHTLTPRADLIAVSSPDPKELEWAARTLEGARAYLDYDEMLREEKDLDAVVIASATIVHAEQAIKAIQRGLHVLCEKPLSTDPEVVGDAPSMSDLESQYFCIFIVRQPVLLAVSISRHSLPDFQGQIPQPESHLRVPAPL